MTTAAATEEVANTTEQPTPDELWAQAQAGRTSTQDDDTDGGQEDPMDGLPESTRKLIEQIQAKTTEQDAALKDVGQKLAKAHGTIGNLSKQLTDSLAQVKQLKPTMDAMEAANKSEEGAKVAARAARRQELDESMAELPEVKEYMDMRFADVKPVEAKPEPAKEEGPTPEQREAQLISERELSDRHPKWMETVKSQEFKTWNEKQPEAVKALGASSDVNDADKMITMFKNHQDDAAKIAKVEAERQERLRRNENVEGKGAANKGGDSSAEALWQKVKRDREKSRAQT